jgi:hypothetical protein
VEIILAVPFLFLFALAMLDFGRGLRSGQEGLRAARHLAWNAERAKEWPGHPGPPGTGEIHDLHFASRGPSPFVSVHSQTLSAGPLAGAAEAVGGVGFLGELGLDDIGHGVIPWFAGVVEASHGEVRQEVRGPRLLEGSAGIRATHIVSIRSRRDEKPEDAEGWWDPYRALLRKLGIPP